MGRSESDPLLANAAKNVHVDPLGISRFRAMRTSAAMLSIACPHLHLYVGHSSNFIRQLDSHF
jgi:hypothetical protein